MHGLTDPPPLLCFGVSGHLGHVPVKVSANVFKIGKECVVVMKDRIVTNIALVDHLEHLRPDRSMNFGIFLMIVTLNMIRKKLGFIVKEFTNIGILLTKK